MLTNTAGTNDSNISSTRSTNQDNFNVHHSNPPKSTFRGCISSIGLNAFKERRGSISVYL